MCAMRSSQFYLNKQKFYKNASIVLKCIEIPLVKKKFDPVHVRF